MPQTDGVSGVGEKTWVVAKRDSTILLLEAAKGAEKRAALIEELRVELNRE